MRQILLDVESAAEIMGVDSSTVNGWCKNHIINCQLAPSDYADKTKYLIEEAESNYVSGLIKKFGTRMALLNYKKDWRGTPREEEKKEEMFDGIPWTLDNDVYEETLPKEEFIEQSYIPQNKEEDDPLVTSIMKAHSLKEKIESLQKELANVQKEYAEIKQNIVVQL